MHFGEKIKELRENKGLLPRQLAASLEIDTPMFSKIERGERKANASRWSFYPNFSILRKMNC